MWSNEVLRKDLSNVYNIRFKNPILQAIYDSRNYSKAGFLFKLYNLLGSASIFLVTVAQIKSRLFDGIDFIYDYLSLDLIYYNSCQFVCLIVLYQLSIGACKISAYFSLFGPNKPNLDFYLDNHKLVIFAFHLGVLVAFLMVFFGYLLAGGATFTVIERFVHEPSLVEAVGIKQQEDT